MTKREAYEKLKVNKRRFYTAIKEHGLGYLFHSRSNKMYFMPGYRITFDMARECEGMSVYDAAEKLKVSFSAFKIAARDNNILHLFKSGGPKVSQEKKDMSGGVGTNLESVHVACYHQGCKEKVRLEIWPGTRPNKYQHCPAHKRAFAA
jgi:hypothetical protein